MRDKPVSIIRGAGKVLAAKLERDGFAIIGQLQDADPRDLADRYGATGLWLARIAQAAGRTVGTGRRDENHLFRNHFSTMIFFKLAELEAVLWRQAERVSARAQNYGLAGRTVIVKLKTAKVRLLTRSASLDAPTQLADRIFRVAQAALKREADGRRFRLLGVGLSNLSAADDADPASLIDPLSDKRAAAERAMDRIRAKFGGEAVGKEETGGDMLPNSAWPSLNACGIDGRLNGKAPMSKVEDRLKTLGIALPTPPAPVASYVPYVVSGNLVFISGQVTLAPDGLKFVGKVWRRHVARPAGKDAAKLCAINLLAQLKAACGGDLDKVKRCVRLGVFVNATPDFTQHPEVGNGASDLIVAALGDADKNGRAATGAGSLPRGVAVEVDGVFEDRTECPACGWRKQDPRPGRLECLRQSGRRALPAPLHPL